MDGLDALRLLHDAATLLTIPKVQALEALSALEHLARCTPVGIPCGSSRASEIGVLEQRKLEVFAVIDLMEITVPDAIVILGKRPDLSGIPKLHSFGQEVQLFKRPKAGELHSVLPGQFLAGKIYSSLGVAA